jgi:hypothetical protein
MNVKLEVVVVPVSHVDRAKRFYETLRFRLDIDYIAGENFRAVQLSLPARSTRSSSARGSRRPTGLRSGFAPRCCRHRSVPRRARPSITLGSRDGQAARLRAS